MSVMLMITSVGGVTAPLAAAARAAGAATVFYTIIDAPRPDKSGIKHPEVCASEDIVFERVNFAYPTRPDLKILDDLSLRLPAGKVTAIVGPSGSGKSTIVGLLERWYEIESLQSGDMVSQILWPSPAVKLLVADSQRLHRVFSGATAPSPLGAGP